MGNVTFAADRFNARRQANNPNTGLEQTAITLKEAETTAKYEKLVQQILSCLKNKFIGGKSACYFTDGSEQNSQEQQAEKACYFYSVVDGQVWLIVEYKMSNSDTNFQYRIETAKKGDQAQTYIINPNIKPISVEFSYKNNIDVKTEYTDVYSSSNNSSLCRLDALSIMLDTAYELSEAEAAQIVNQQTPKLHLLKLTKI